MLTLSLVPKLTVIMPVYNEEEYIAFAIESVLQQKTEFPFVLLIIDDTSTDATLSISKMYQDYVEQQHKTQGLCAIKIITKKKNRGKGHSMYLAYNEMIQYQEKGYFIVLDGDDFFTINSKLQKQVDYLELHPEFIGCGHSYILKDSIKNNISISCQNLLFQENHAMEVGVHNLEDHPLYYYFHTSTMMYRNIFTHPIPTYFAKSCMRGDVSLSLWFNIQSAKRIGFCPIIGSCYNYHGDGIWSGIKEEEQKESIIHLMNYLCTLTTNATYHKSLLGILNLGLDFINQYEQDEEKNKIEDILLMMKQFFSHMEMLCDATENKSNDIDILGNEFIDMMLENYGKIVAAGHKILMVNKKYNPKHIGIMCSGGEKQADRDHICMVAQAHKEQGDLVYIFCTGLYGEINPYMAEFCNENGISMYQYKDTLVRDYIDTLKENTGYLLKNIYSLDINKLYCYIYNKDFVGSICMQKGIAKEIALDILSFNDVVGGIYSTTVDTIIVHDAMYLERVGRYCDKNVNIVYIDKESQKEGIQSYYDTSTQSKYIDKKSRMAIS